MISWRTPCRSNGNITKFDIVVDGDLNSQVSILFVSNQIKYNISMENMVKGASYNISVQAYGETKGASTSIFCRFPDKSMKQQKYVTLHKILIKLTF